MCSLILATRIPCICHLLDLYTTGNADNLIIHMHNMIQISRSQMKQIQTKRANLTYCTNEHYRTIYFFVNSQVRSTRNWLFSKIISQILLSRKQSRANHLTALLMKSRLPHVHGLFSRCTGRSTGVPREQLNLISSYIDGNMIYGSNVGRNKVLRTLAHGKMKVWKQEMLPVCQVYCALKKVGIKYFL
jgi:hypothetical protein